jgi:hypothetical protein
VTANDETEDDGKDSTGSLEWKPETEESTLSAEAEEQPYNPDNDTDGETALCQNHRKAPPRTHDPRSFPHTGDNNSAEARQTPSPFRKSP